MKELEFTVKVKFLGEVDKIDSLGVADKLAQAVRRQCNSTSYGLRAPHSADVTVTNVEIHTEYNNTIINFDFLGNTITKKEKESKELNFNYQDLDEDNTADLQKWVDADELFGLIDEKEGGIIGYLNHVHIDRITGMLNDAHLNKK